MPLWNLFKHPWSSQGAPVYQRGQIVEQLHWILVVQAFDINWFWRGSSVCFGEATSPVPFAYTIAQPIVAHEEFILVISWLTTEGVRYRYKLWDASSADVELPAYGGEAIPVGATYEYWSVEDYPVASIPSFTMQLNILATQATAINPTIPAYYIYPRSSI